MKNKKTIAFFVTLSILFVIGITATVIMFYYDIQIGNDIAKQAKLATAETITQEAFLAYLNARTPARYLLTIGALLTAVGGIVCLVLVIKKISAILSEKKAAKELR